MSSEKKVECKLFELLKKNNFNDNFIFYNPNNNNTLKKIFEKCSKNNTNNIGIPDRIYYYGKTLIIFECKRDSLNKAIEDLKKYNRKLELNNLSLNIFSVAFIDINNYKIFKFDANNNLLIELENKLIILETFNLNKIEENTFIDMISNSYIFCMFYYV